MNGTFTSGGLHAGPPPGRAGRAATSPGPGVILCHGFPIGPLDARRSAGTFPQLIDRIAHDLGYAAMTFNFRGTGTSERRLLAAGVGRRPAPAIDYLIARDAADARSCCRHEHRRLDRHLRRRRRPAGAGRGLLSPRADFDDWAEHPRRFLEHAREIGAIRSPGFPASVDEWSRAFRRFRPTDAARRFAPRPLLVMHGDDDESVPTSDARQLAAAHGTAELSLFAGAGHRLRHDPRAIAVLLGWLDRVPLPTSGPFTPRGIDAATACAVTTEEEAGAPRQVHRREHAEQTGPGRQGDTVVAAAAVRTAPTYSAGTASAGRHQMPAIAPIAIAAVAAGGTACRQPQRIRVARRARRVSTGRTRSTAAPGRAATRAGGR